MNPFQAIGLDGRMTNIAGPLSGMLVCDARAKAIQLLTSMGKIHELEDRQQEIPVSERGENPIEIILLKEWYVKQVGAQDRMRHIIDDIRFILREKQTIVA